METLIAAVLVAGVVAAAWWRSASRSSPSVVGFGSNEAEEQQGDLFVLQPSAEPAPTDRPPTAISVARIVAIVVVSTLVMVATTWLIGLGVKAVLDGYFSSG